MKEINDLYLAKRESYHLIPRKYIYILNIETWRKGWEEGAGVGGAGVFRSGNHGPCTGWQACATMLVAPGNSKRERKQPYVCGGRPPLGKGARGEDP
jgi:hypothetical protein